MSSSRRSTFVATAAVIITAAVGGGVAVGAALSGGGSSTGGPGARPSTGPSFAYGKVPGWLSAQAAENTDTLLHGSAARPALTAEGDKILATLPDGGPSVLISVVGPETPGEGLPYQTKADTATWTVTMSHATGAVRISARAFSAIDSLGKVYRPAYVSYLPKPPHELLPGQTVSFELRTVMRVGEGDMRWAPTHDDLLGTWDFVVEND